MSGLSPSDGNGDSSDDLRDRRETLVRSLRSDISDARVLDAFLRVPRELFIDAGLQQHAYEDRPLPIGHGQTTSQPRMIALMLQELKLQGEERVLEVGSGCGYQTALLALLSREVIAVELIEDFVRESRLALAQLGLTNVQVFQAGDELGWPPLAPYESIIVAAASPRIPQSLVDQLAPGGRLVLPVGNEREQDLVVAEDREEGIVVTRKGGCRFVPLFGREANPRPRDPDADA